MFPVQFQNNMTIKNVLCNKKDSSLFANYLRTFRI